MDVLLVMSPQNSFLSPTGSAYLGEHAETLKIRLADYLATFKRPRIFLREKHAMEDSFFSSDVTHSVATTEDYQVEESLKKYGDFSYDRTRYSALYDTPIDVFLRQKGAHEIGIVGIETHTSVLFTAEDLRNRGYGVTVIEPCTVSRDNALHGFAISLMCHSLGVKVTNG